MAILLAVAATGNHPTTSYVEPVVTTRRHGTFVDVDGTGAIVASAYGSVTWAVDARGRVAWRHHWSARALACARCPGAVQTDPLRTVTKTGATADPGWLAGTTTYQDVYLSKVPEGVAISTLGPDGPVALGTIGARSLDPSAYGFAPQVGVAADARSATAVTGPDDPLAVGSADLLYLRAGRPALHHQLQLPAAGEAPTPCTPDGSARWGWLASTGGDEPWLGTARLTVATGEDVGATARLERPYSDCHVIASGYALAAANSGARGVYPAVAWLDRSGHLRREVHRHGLDTTAHVSIAHTGRAVLPSGRGFDVVEPSGASHHLAADDVRVAADGTVWVLRGTRVTRWQP